MNRPTDTAQENSRRFRALPIYASLLSRGKAGYASIVRSNIAFARRLERWMRTRPEYEVLTPECTESDHTPPQPWTGDWGTTILLFRASPVDCPVAAFRDPIGGHLALTDAIKRTRKMYVSPTVFAGIGGVRIAVSNWATGDADFDIVTDVLMEVMREEKQTSTDDVA